MAERAKGKAKPKKKMKGNVVTLKAKGPRKAKKGDNNPPSGPDDKVIAVHHKAMNSKWADVETAKKAYDQAKGVYQSARKAAKAQGINLNAYDINRELEKQDLGHVQIDYADARKYQEIMESPLLELDLFKGVEMPVQTRDSFLQGQQAYDNNEKLDNNPHLQGSELFEKWREGWIAKQKATAMEMAPAAGAVN